MVSDENCRYLYVWHQEVYCSWNFAVQLRYRQLETDWFRCVCQYFCSPQEIEWGGKNLYCCYFLILAGEVVWESPIFGCPPESFKFQHDKSIQRQKGAVSAPFKIVGESLNSKFICIWTQALRNSQSPQGVRIGMIIRDTLAWNESVGYTKWFGVPTTVVSSLIPTFLWN